MSGQHKRTSINWWRVAALVFAFFFIGSWLALPRLGSRSFEADAANFAFWYRFVAIFGMGLGCATFFAWLTERIANRRGSWAKVTGAILSVAVGIAFLVIAFQLFDIFIRPQW
jgi:hypothetical protein